MIVRDETLLETIMGIIMGAGDSKNYSMEAIHEAKKGNFVKSDDLIQAAEESLKEAHKHQTYLLTQEANGSNLEISLLLIHAQDHLMTSITFKDLAIEIIDIHKNK